MPDMTDDWMNPPTSISWQSNSDARPRPFLVERKAAIICTFVGRRPTEWKRYSTHETRGTRDAELARLREDHPAWRLRPAHERSLLWNREVRVEDEEADLLRLLARVQATKAAGVAGVRASRHARALGQPPLPHGRGPAGASTSSGSRDATHSRAISVGTMRSPPMRCSRGSTAPYAISFTTGG